MSPLRPTQSAIRERVISRQTSLVTVGLFSGIGGFELGMERAGHHTAVLCELLPEARAVLRDAQEHGVFRSAKVLEDVTSHSLPASLPSRIDVLTAGFPCQDLSQAGKTSGIHGRRSGLIGHVLEIIQRRPQANRPRWILLENVSFMRHLAAGKAMEFVLSGLSELGYSWAYREIDTRAFGLPQRRKRLFIAACRHDEGDPRAVLFGGDETPVAPRHEPAWRDGRACGFYWTEGNRGVGWADDAIPPLKGGSGLGIPSPPAVILPPDGRVVVPTIEDAERLQGFRRGWTKAAGLEETNSRRIRWLLVGNAVSVPVAEWLGRRLLDTECSAQRVDTRLPEGGKWPPAAWQLRPDEPRHAVDIGAWPVRREPTSLLSILREDDHCEQPALSPRAAAGFLRRFESSNLYNRNPEHRSALLEVLRRHVDHALEP